MENSLNDSPPIESVPAKQRLSWLTPSRKVLLWILGWSVLQTVEAVFLSTRIPPQYDSIPLVVFALGYGVLILAWAKADSAERGEELTHAWKFMLVLFGILTLCAYFFKTRGFPRGLLSIVYAIGFYVGQNILDVIIAIPLMMFNVLVLGGKMPK